MQTCENAQDTALFHFLFCYLENFAVNYKVTRAELEKFLLLHSRCPITLRQVGKMCCRWTRRVCVRLPKMPELINRREFNAFLLPAPVGS